MARDHRRLAAIVSADVAGYSRLMARDESSTLSALKAYRRELIDPKIAEHGGRIVKTTGDGLLLEFPSVVDAVRCAVDMQRGLTERNAALASDQQIAFRVGINVGDIIIDGDDIFGDGVNLAARLQALAEPGEICVSKVVRDQVVDKLNFAFEDLGERRVKNIPRPVEVFRVRLGTEPNAPSRRRWLRPGRSGRWLWLVAGVAALGIAVFLSGPLPRPWRLAPTPTSQAMSVAMVRLAAPQGDSESERFADVLTRNLMSQLGRETGYEGRLRVVVPQGNPVGEGADLGELGRHLNVHYLVQGSVLRNGQGHTVNLQLLDAASGAQVWSEQDTLQDSDVAAASSARLRNLAQELRIAVRDAEEQRVSTQPVSDLTAAELVLQAWGTWDKEPSLDAALQARKLVERALQLEPDLVSALLTRVFLMDQEYGLDPNADRTRIAGAIDKDTSRAVELDPPNPTAWTWRAYAQLYLGRWDAALEAIHRAIKLDPDNPWILGNQAAIMNLTGRPADALTIIDRARAAMDRGTGSADSAAITAGSACLSYLLLGQAERAVSSCEKAAVFSRGWIVQVLLVAAYADQGDWTGAKAAKAELLRIVPGFTVAQARGYDEPLHPDYATLAEKYIYEGLRKAGIPER